MSLQRYEVQQVYLEVQSGLGRLIESTSSDADRKQLLLLSQQLLRIKRNMIGHFDEVDTENLML